MPRGGSRPGAGRPRGSNKATSAPAIAKAARSANQTPLEYMLAVMNDPDAEETRRDRMAQAAAPYVHGKISEAPKSKKEERQDAAEKAAGAGGKFAPPTAPRVVVNNG